MAADITEKLIKNHNLLPHPEGGFYKETYRSDHSTGIYFLLKKGDYSALHMIKSDEMWHFYGGDSLIVVEVDENGSIIETLINSDNPQYVVKANRWFGSYLPENSRYAFCGCTVSPPFEFKDFKLANFDDIKHYSEDVREKLKNLIRND